MEKVIQNVVIMPYEELAQIKRNQQQLIDLIKKNAGKNQEKKRYITAQQFMDSLSISRCTFDLLREENKIRVIQRGRRLYLPETEIERYMNS
jgi:hypothetical protein